MKIDELIETLQRLRTQHGNIPVVAYDGMEPSRVESVECADVGQYYFFEGGTGATRTAVHIF